MLETWGAPPKQRAEAFEGWTGIIWNGRWRLCWVRGPNDARENLQPRGRSAPGAFGFPKQEAVELALSKQQRTERRLESVLTAKGYTVKAQHGRRGLPAGGSGFAEYALLTRYNFSPDFFPANFKPARRADRDFGYKKFRY